MSAVREMIARLFLSLGFMTITSIRGMFHPSLFPVNKRLCLILNVTLFAD